VYCKQARLRGSYSYDGENLPAGVRQLQASYALLRNILQPRKDLSEKNFRRLHERAGSDSKHD
jgi:hypothetical protein